MTGMQGSFDASQFEPSQSIGAHPAGIFDAHVSSTSITPTKDGEGGMFVVEFTTPAGRIFNRYNIWNKSPKAAEIAHKQLSALCYATGIFKLDWQNEGVALRNARLKIEVGKQENSEYMEVKRVLDVNGNEPGRVPTSAPNPQGNQGWGAPNGAAQPQSGGGWSNQPQQSAAPQAPQGSPSSQGGWAPGPTQQPAQTQPDNRPPWAR